jgi:hypothetical protein
MAQPPPGEIEFDPNEIEFSADEISESPTKKIPTGAGEREPDLIDKLVRGSQLATGGAGSGEAMGQFLQMLRRNPAAVGGAAGAMAGGPFGVIPGIAAATLGGAGGAGYGIVDEAVTGGGTGPPRVSPSMEADADRMAVSGAIQGASEGIGGTLMRGLGGGSKWLYNKLLSPSKQLGKEFGEEALTQAGLEGGHAINKAGAQAADEATSASRAKVLDLVKSHADTAAPITAREVAREGEFGAVRGELRRRARIGQESEVPAVKERLKNMAEGMHGPREPVLQDVAFKDVPRGKLGPGGNTSVPAGSVPVTGGTTPGSFSPTAPPPRVGPSGSFGAGQVQNLTPRTTTGQNLAAGRSPGSLSATAPVRSSGSFTNVTPPVPAATGGGWALNPSTPIKAVPGKVHTKLTGPGIDLMEGQLSKETAQKSAYGGRRMTTAGSQKQESAVDLLDEAVATGLKKAVEKRAPGIGAQNAITQKNMGLTRAIEEAVKRNDKRAPFGARELLAIIGGGGAGIVGGGVPGGITAAMLIRALTSPSMGSKYAIAAHRAAPHIPKVVQGGRGLAALLSSHDPEE